MKTVFIVLLIALVLAERPCDVEDMKDKPWCDLTKTFEERAKDLVDALTFDEKIVLSGNTATAVPRLHIPKYEWWNEALHGVAYSPGVHYEGEANHATSFPQVSTTACSFNTTLFHNIAEIISTEARIFNNKGNAGLTYWTPNINIVRDPRWGRGQETSGEDPILTSKYAEYFVKGLQEGEDSRYIKASACCKHYTAYDLEDWNGVWRHNFDAQVTEADMEDTFQVPFESCVVKAKVTSLMCSYNRVNGVPSCANKEILTEVARGKWGFDGYITGDCGAIDDIVTYHKYAQSQEQALKMGLEAGTDIDCGGNYQAHMADAVHKGYVDIRDLDRALRHLFKVQMRLGLFDPLENQVYTKYDVDQLESPEHVKVAEEACEQGIVLLKNLNNALPLKNVSSIALIGPSGNNAKDQLGNYNGGPKHIITPLEALQQRGTVEYEQGCNDIKCQSINNYDHVLEIASKSDITVLAMGINQDIEAEGRDRVEITLPGKQQELIEAVTKASKGPVILVISSGSSVDINFAKNNDKIQGIFWVGYASAQEGEALAKLIYGDVNPSGRLVYTIYPGNYVNQVPLTDMNMRPNKITGNPGRTYKFYTGEVIYPFGYGLSYTNYEYNIMSETKSIALTEITKQLQETSRFEALPIISMKISVANKGNREGSTSILVYVEPPFAGIDGIPLKQLATFTKVFIPAGESVDVELSLTAYALSINTDGQRRSFKGDWIIRVEDKEFIVAIN
ncbi:hypothetical protein WA158_002798 [Blastocystis sp. Blastoise]